MELPALPVPVVGPIHVSQSPIDRGRAKPNVTTDHLAFYAAIYLPSIACWNNYHKSLTGSS